MQSHHYSYKPIFKYLPYVRTDGIIAWKTTHERGADEDHVNNDAVGCRLMKRMNLVMNRPWRARDSLQRAVCTTYSNEANKVLGKHKRKLQELKEHV